MARRNRTPSSVRTRAGTLDVAVCERARVSRDWRFDGQFFSGVRTTRIYCRPVCPVRPAKAENVRFYPSAAAAERAGFRPCLRCRPETAPFSPAWKGSLATVERGVRMIGEGALDRASVEALAASLGVGPRHLSHCSKSISAPAPGRLPGRHACSGRSGCLIDTELPMIGIASHAGFRSLRRFNAVFAEVYKRPPSEIRRARRNR